MSNFLHFLHRLDDGPFFVEVAFAAFLGFLMPYPFNAVQFCLVYFGVVTRAWVKANPSEEVETS